MDLALSDAEIALEKTNYEISLVKQLCDVLKEMNNYQDLRKFVKEQVDKFDETNQRKGDAIELINYWIKFEYELIISEQPNKYYDAINLMVKVNSDYDANHQLLEEACIIAKRFKNIGQVREIEKRISQIDRDIKHEISALQKRMNRAHSNGNSSEANRQASIILAHGDSFDHINEMKNALRVLLQNLSTAKKYREIVHEFNRYENIGSIDSGCVSSFQRAEKELLVLEKEEIINQITANILNAEATLRKFVMKGFDDKEEDFLAFIEPKLKERQRSNFAQYDWVNAWQTNKKKALVDSPILEFSVLPQLKQILIWLINSNDKRFFPKQNITKPLLQKIINSLKDHAIIERNDVFHARAINFDMEKLQEYKADSNRLQRRSLELLECHEKPSYV